MRVVAARDLVAGPADEAGDDERGERIENRPAEPRAGERDDDRERRPDVAARLNRIGHQHFAAQPLGCARFVGDDEQVHADGDQHHDEAGDRDRVWRGAAAQVIEGVPQHFDEQQQQEHRERGRGDRLVLPVSVRMILVRRLTRGVNADQADDVRRAVGQRVKAVGQDADRAARVAERDLRHRDGEVQDENAGEDEGDFGVSRGDWGLGTRGWGLEGLGSGFGDST